MRDNQDLIKMIDISGNDFVIISKWDKQAYSKGWRYGDGEALAVVKPATLLEFLENT